MEIVYFVLGVVTVLLVLGVVVIVRVGTLVKKLKEEVQFLERGSNDVADGVHRRIDEEIRELNSRINFNEREFFSQLDSRLDKLENKLDSRLLKVENKVAKIYLSEDRLTIKK